MNEGVKGIERNKGVKRKNGVISRGVKLGKKEIELPVSHNRRQ